MKNEKGLPEITINGLGSLIFKIPKSELEEAGTIVDWMCNKWGIELSNVYLDIQGCKFITVD